MSKSKPYTSNKYFVLFLFFVFAINNSFAVKPINDRAQEVYNPVNVSEKQLPKNLGLKEKILLKILKRKVRKESSDILRELEVTHLKSAKTIKIEEGSRLKVQTIDDEKYKGLLQIIDDEHISINGDVIALENISKVRYWKKGYLATGISFIILTPIAFGLLTLVLFDDRVRSEFNIGILLLILLVFLLPILSLFLLIPKIFTNSKWKFSASDKAVD